MKPSLLVCCPTGWDLIRGWTVRWLCSLHYYLGLEREFEYGSVRFIAPKSQHVDACRNEAANLALQGGFTHLLTIDPDIVPDRYVGNDKREVFFWPSSWQWALDHPCSVVAAPYRGEPPRGLVQVFKKDSQGKRTRYTPEEAAACVGFHEVGAVGAGLLLIDTDVFRRLDKPFFRTVYNDASESGVLIGEDVYFSLNCDDHNVPIWCNFDSWCGHRQVGTVEKPYWDAINERSLVEIDCDRRIGSTSTGVAGGSLPGPGGHLEIGGPSGGNQPVDCSGGVEALGGADSGPQAQRDDRAGDDGTDGQRPLCRVWKSEP